MKEKSTTEMLWEMKESQETAMRLIAGMMGDAEMSLETGFAILDGLESVRQSILVLGAGRMECERK